MSNGLIMNLTNAAIILLLFAIGIAMPDITRKEIFFGIKVPQEHRNRDELMGFKKQYRRNFSLSGGTAAVLFIAAGCLYDSNIFFPIALFILLILESINYYMIHLKVRKLKEHEKWEDKSSGVVVVDTSFRTNRDKRIMVSPLWFLLPVVLILINLIVGFGIYDNLPEAVALRWDSAGRITGMAAKSYRVILMLPMIQLMVTGLMFFVYKTIGWSKQQLNSQDIEASREQNRLFRLRWSGYTVFMCTMMILMFTMVNFAILGVIKINPQHIGLTVVIPAIILIASALIMSLWTGQGGSRIRIVEGRDKGEKIIDRDDDRYWKLGTIYYNPDDPALFIEKRFGIGWSINFGRPLAVIIILGILASAFLIPLIGSLL